MKDRRRAIVGILCGTLLMGGAHGYAADAQPAAKAGELTARKPVQPPALQAPDVNWLKDVEVGTRLSCFFMIEDRKKHFLGSIDELREQQDWMPNKLYADWAFAPEWAMEVAWDHIRVETRTDTEDNHTDGDFLLSMPLVLALWRPQISAGYPSVGLGVVYGLADFDHAAWWQNGWSSPQAYRDSGEPEGPRNRKTRKMDPKDSLGMVLAGHWAMPLAPDWFCEIFARYVYVNVDTRYTISMGRRVIDDNGITEIPLSHLAAGAGIKYCF